MKKRGRKRELGRKPGANVRAAVAKRGNLARAPERGVRPFPPPPPPPPPPGQHGSRPSEVLAARELFWHNVIREILTSLSMICALRPREGDEETEDGQERLAEASMEEGSPEGAGANGGDGRPRFDPMLFDGRLAVMTEQGERVAIADVFPLFACGINAPSERGLSLALECTVFQIRTPGGQVYTLPLHEIRTFHALTPELMQRLEKVSRRRQRQMGTPEEQQQPFGFAAFTSLVQGAPRPLEPAPEFPME